MLFRSRPRSKFPELISDYPNLYYACRKCNGHKSETWPSQDQRARGLLFADPCAEDLYTEHLRERENGALQALTVCGIYSSRHIRLDRSELLRWRRLRAEARTDLPRFAGLARFLDSLISLPDTPAPKREEIAMQLEAVKRRIEESKRRFSLE